MHLNKIHFVLPILLAALFLLPQCTSPSGKTAFGEAEKTAYLEKGKAIAAETFANLSGRLAAALESGGVQQAVPVCQAAAMSITDSLSQLHNAVIRRTSLQVRNPKNAPAEWEKKVLQDFETKAKAGGEIKPFVQMLDDGSVAFAAPIRIMPLCLQCHGKPGETLTPDYDAIIKTLYPADQAIGYADGQLRGMWSIVFKK